MMTGASNQTTEPAAPSWTGAEIWKAVLRHWRLALGVFAGVFACSVMALLVLPKRYVATAAIIVAQQELGVEMDKQISADKLGDPADLESQVLLVRSPRILRMTLMQKDVRDAILRECIAREEKSALSRLFGASAAKCEARINDENKLWEYISPYYSISGAGRSRIITVAYESQIPAVGKTMANALTTTFLNDRREGLIGKREDAISHLRQQMQQLEDSLRDDQEKIQAFRRKNGLISGASSASIAAERLSSVGQTLTQAEAARAEAAARLSSIHLRNEMLEQSPGVLANRTIGDLKQQMILNANQIASQSMSLGPLHPEMQALERQRSALKRRLDIEMANQAASTKENYATANAAMTSIHKNLDSLKADVADVADKEVAISYTLRDDENKRRQIGELARKIGDLEIQKRLISSGTELVNLAELPVTVFFPKATPFISGGLIMGLMMAGAAVIMADRQAAGRDRKRLSGADQIQQDSTAQDFAQQVDARIIGATPFVATPAQIQPFEEPAVGWKKRFLSKSTHPTPSIKPSLKQVLDAAQSDYAMQEILAKFYATIRLKSRIMSCRTLSVTSLRTQEGKTFTALALARHIAERGRSALVVECDFATPVIAELLALAPTPGLAEVLRGEAASADAVSQTDHSNLYVMPAGNGKEAAEDLLTSPRMEIFLRWAARFDYVFIDTPAYEPAPHAPSSLNPHAMLLAPLVDAILCCARAGVGDAKGLGFMLEDLRDAEGVVLGVVIAMDDAGTNTEKAGAGSARPSALDCVTTAAA